MVSKLHQPPNTAARQADVSKDVYRLLRRGDFNASAECIESRGEDGWQTMYHAAANKSRPQRVGMTPVCFVCTGRHAGNRDSGVAVPAAFDAWRRAKALMPVVGGHNDGSAGHRLATAHDRGIRVVPAARTPIRQMGSTAKLCISAPPRGLLASRRFASENPRASIARR